MRKFLCSFIVLLLGLMVVFNTPTYANSLKGPYVCTDEQGYSYHIEHMTSYTSDLDITPCKI